MKFYPKALIATLLLTSSFAQAGVVIGGTRLIYDGSKKESSLSVSNPDQTPYLIQTWVDATDGSAEKAPFIITPPLFRLDGGQHNVLRVVRAGGNMPNDRESLYWMNIKSIPSTSKKVELNTLQIAVKTRFKLIYRPKGLNGVPETRSGELTWQRQGNQLQVKNPTPFYMNFQQITLAGKEIKSASYVAPMATASFEIPAAVNGNSVTWAIINDFGGTGEKHTASVN